MSTSYSSSDLIMVGGGDKKFGPCMAVSLYGDRKVVWNTLWILHVDSSRRQYVIGDRTCVILKGPCHLGDNFLEG